MSPSSPRPVVLFSKDEIARRVAEVGAEIGAAFGDTEICVVGLMKSCLVFLADLIRAVPRDLTVHLLKVHSPADADADPAPARSELLYSMPIPYEGRDILLLDDIVDTGITLSYLLDHIREHRPRSLRVCALIDKPGERKLDLHPDWSLFRLENPLPDRFLVGYGLDYAESFRGLPYIGTIPRQSA